MANLLFVASSLFGDESQSRLIASEFIDRWRQSHPDTIVVERDLAADGIPHLSQAAFAASLTPAGTRSTAEHQAAALADVLIEEVEAADVIVIAAPMYNFSIPSTLKAWIDHITRAGRTFRYGAGGAEGLLKGKEVFVIAAAFTAATVRPRAWISRNPICGRCWVSSASTSPSSMSKA
jgi:FMN-dependent NADH-azoreductase